MMPIDSRRPPPENLADDEAGVTILRPHLVGLPLVSRGMVRGVEERGKDAEANGWEGGSRAAGCVAGGYGVRRMRAGVYGAADLGDGGGEGAVHGRGGCARGDDGADYGDAAGYGNGNGDGYGDKHGSAGDGNEGADADGGCGGYIQERVCEGCDDPRWDGAGARGGIRQEVGGAQQWERGVGNGGEDPLCEGDEPGDGEGIRCAGGGAGSARGDLSADGSSDTAWAVPKRVAVVQGRGVLWHDADGSDCEQGPEPADGDETADAGGGGDASADGATDSGAGTGASAAGVLQDMPEGKSMWELVHQSGVHLPCGDGVCL